VVLFKDVLVVVPVPQLDTTWTGRECLCAPEPRCKREALDRNHRKEQGYLLYNFPQQVPRLLIIEVSVRSRHRMGRDGRSGDRAA
jgi:hypothetical protein